MRVRLGVLGAVYFASVSIGGDAMAEPDGPEQRVAEVLRASIKTCWATVADLPEPERLTVKVNVALDEDGALMGEPRILIPEEIDPYDEAMQTAVDRAMRAVKKCAPYELPAEHYLIWSTMTFNFKHQRSEPLAIPLG